MAKASPAKLKYMAEYQKQPEQEAKRVARNKARRHDIAKGLVHKGDGMEVDHIKPLDEGGSKSDSNTRVVSASANRSWRDSKPGMYGGKKK
jgi:hypothetical protein